MCTLRQHSMTHTHNTCKKSEGLLVEQLLFIVSRIKRAVPLVQGNPTAKEIYPNVGTRGLGSFCDTSPLVFLPNKSGTFRRLIFLSSPIERYVINNNYDLSHTIKRYKYILALIENSVKIISHHYKQ